MHVNIQAVSNSAQLGSNSEQLQEKHCFRAALCS